MKIELWGVRGSLPTPLTDTEYQQRIKEILLSSAEKNIKPEDIDRFISDLPSHLRHVFGGNTTCVTVESSSGKLYIIDCGTGIRPLGDKLMQGKSGKGQEIITILLTHTHWDHVQGFPFFKPVYIPGNVINFYSPFNDLQQRFEYQQDFRFFPKKLEEMASSKTFTKLEYGKTFSPEKGLDIDMFRLKHPGGSFAYRFRENGKTFIFCTDAEFIGESVEKFTNEDDCFFNNADVLILDSQYTLDESFVKLFWGHTSYTMAINCGVRWNIKHLVLTHHEPSYSDSRLEQNFDEAKEHLKLTGSPMTLSIATEGTIFKL
ncbi:MAG: MBL fold metallo-hydrolase [Spirochaetes bacterium]|nr:MBL fold metallo-hydrolase [Spirochaetota bacterium]